MTIIDRNGHTTTNTYDGNGNLTQVSAPIDSTHNQVTQYHYTDMSHPDDMTDETDPNTKDWLVTYTSAGDIASKTAPATTHPTSVAGGETTYTYDGAGRLTSTVAPNGNVSGGTPTLHRSAVGYDPAGNKIGAVDALGQGVVDSFARTASSSSLGTSDTGDTWSAVGSAVWGIQHSGAYLATASGTTNLAETTGVADGQITFSEPSPTTGLGVVFRGDASNNTGFVVEPNSSSGVWTLYKVTSGGTLTSLGSTAASTCCTANQVVTIRFAGTSIKVAVDGVTSLTVTNSSYTTNTHIGLFVAGTGTGQLTPFVYSRSGGDIATAGYDPDGNQAWANDAPRQPHRLHLRQQQPGHRHHPSRQLKSWHQFRR